MTNPLDPNAGTGGGLHHRFGGGQTNPNPLGGPAGNPLQGGRQKNPHAIKLPRKPKAPKQRKSPRQGAAPTQPGPASGGHAATRTPTTIHLRGPVFLPKTDANIMFGDEKPGTVVILISPTTGQILGMLGNQLVVFGHHPQANGRLPASTRRAGPHIAEPARATILSFDAPSNTAQVFPVDQSDGQPQTVHVNPDIAPARLVQGAVVGITRGSDSDPTDAIITHIAQ